MVKKFFAALVAVLMIFATGCNNDADFENLSDYESEASTVIENEEPAPELLINPLTGVAELADANKVNRRPVAVMINNLDNTVRKVQTGLSKADIIYETEVEGGLTRLMAIYQDISDLDKIGTVRSARYQYIDLALGHNAVYVHFGFNTYCRSHLTDVDDIEFKDNSKGSKRISNGLATEHTAYALAKELNERISNEFNMSVKSVAPWVNFTDETLTLDGGPATSVNIPYPASSTTFTYDSASGLYTRLLGSTVQTDYFTQEKTQVKNIFILLTSMSYYSDGKTRKVDFSSGDGYYITNGTVQFIKWEKGASTNGFKFTDTNGNEIKVSAGNSWVSIANKSTCNPSIQ